MEVDVLKKECLFMSRSQKVQQQIFDEVCLCYNKEEAVAEASRCLQCKNHNV